MSYEWELEKEGKFSPNNILYNITYVGNRDKTLRVVDLLTSQVKRGMGVHTMQ